MSNVSRRKWLAAGIGTASTVAAGATLADKYDLIPPDHGGFYGPGETLTYAAHRLLTRNALAKEFPRSSISEHPFANTKVPKMEAYKKSQALGFTDWRLKIDGMVDRPQELSVADLKSYPSLSQITHLACEEGWSYIAEWTGAPLSSVLETVGIQAKAKYVVYFSMQASRWDSVDIDEALHPQTLVAYGLNGGELPLANGGPMRMRVPRQLGYKSIKWINRITVTDSLKGFGKGLGAAAPEAGYSWYAGI